MGLKSGLSVHVERFFPFLHRAFDDELLGNISGGARWGAVEHPVLCNFSIAEDELTVPVDPTKLGSHGFCLLNVLQIFDKENNKSCE